MSTKRSISLNICLHFFCLRNEGTSNQKNCSREIAKWNFCYIISTSESCIYDQSGVLHVYIDMFNSCYSTLNRTPDSREQLRLICNKVILLMNGITDTI